MDIHKELALKYDIDIREIRKICNSPFKFMRHNIKNTDFLSLSGEQELNYGLKYLGIFYLQPTRMYAINKIRNESNIKSIKKNKI